MGNQQAKVEICIKNYIILALIIYKVKQLGLIRHPIIGITALSIITHFFYLKEFSTKCHPFAHYDSAGKLSETTAKMVGQA